MTCDAATGKRAGVDGTNSGGHSNVLCNIPTVSTIESFVAGKNSSAKPIEQLAALSGVLQYLFTSGLATNGVLVGVVPVTISIINRSIPQKGIPQVILAI